MCYDDVYAVCKPYFLSLNIEIQIIVIHVLIRVCINLIDYDYG